MKLISRDYLRFMFKLRKYAITNFITIFLIVLCLGLYSDYAMAQKNSNLVQSEQTDPFKDVLESTTDFSEDEQIKQSIMVCYFTESVTWVQDFNKHIHFPDYPSSYWQPPKN